MKRLVLLQCGVSAIAVVTAVAPWPADLIERHFANGLYAHVQPVVTSWSNGTSVSLFDLLIGALIVTLAVVTVRGGRRAVGTRSVVPLVHTILALAAVTSVVYLWFVLAWGLNYGRPPLERQIGVDASRVHITAVRALAARAAGEVNRLHGPAHAAGFPRAGEIPAALVTALHDTERQLGRPGRVTPSRPKRTLLGVFFRSAGVDGMHAPFLFETLLNPHLTPPERPAVIAHEWAHLAGYAPESEASFVGLLTALRADAPSQYSAWLALFDHAASALPRAEHRELIALLNEGPKADRQAIAARMRARVEAVSKVSWEAYDRYLKAQGVAEGIQSYSGVVRLLLGSGVLDAIEGTQKVAIDP
jgi:Zn-dependent protease with chaperone function